MAIDKVDEIPRARVGREAPDFCLPAASGQKTSLHGLRGRGVVMLFLPEPWTPEAEAELLSLERLQRSWGQEQVAVTAISCDGVPGLKAFARRLHLSLPLLSDSRREVSRLYGVLCEDSYFPQPALFLVDPQGRLCYQQVAVPGLGWDFAGLDETLRRVLAGPAEGGEGRAGASGGRGLAAGEADRESDAGFEMGSEAGVAEEPGGGSGPESGGADGARSSAGGEAEAPEGGRGPSSTSRPIRRPRRLGGPRPSTV